MKLSLEAEAGRVAELVQLLLDAGHGASAASLAGSLVARCPQSGLDAALDLLCHVLDGSGSSPPGTTVVLDDLADAPGRAAMVIDRAFARSGSGGVVQAAGLLGLGRGDRMVQSLRVAVALATAGRLDALAQLADHCAGSLDARGYLEALRELRAVPADVAGPMAVFHRTLARQVVAHAEYPDKVGALTLRVDVDAAVEALVDATLAAGHDPLPWLDRQCTTGRWDLLLRLLQRASAEGSATPELQLREAEAREHLGDTQGADRLEQLASDAIARRLDPNPRAPTLSTLMFRNLPMLACIVELVRCALARAGGQPVRVHVAAASTGEEAFSLAMWLQAEALLEHVELLVSDVDAAAVEQARRGLVSRRLSTRIPERFLAQLKPSGEEHYLIPPEVFQRLDIRVLDLVGSAAGMAPPADVLVLNNLTVHLSLEDRLRLVGTLAERTRPDGFVVMGGDDLAPLASALGAEGFRPVLAGARACHEGWTIQRRAWYRLPRRYWALPPYRNDEQVPARYASVFCRSAADWETATRAIERLSLSP